MTFRQLSYDVMKGMPRADTDKLIADVCRVTQQDPEREVSPQEEAELRTMHKQIVHLAATVPGVPVVIAKFVKTAIERHNVQQN